MLILKEIDSCDFYKRCMLAQRIQFPCGSY